MHLFILKHNAAVKCFKRLHITCWWEVKNRSPGFLCFHICLCFCFFFFSCLHLDTQAFTVLFSSPTVWLMRKMRAWWAPDVQPRSTHHGPFWCPTWGMKFEIRIVIERGNRQSMDWTMLESRKWSEESFPEEEREAETCNKLTIAPSCSPPALLQEGGREIWSEVEPGKKEGMCYVVWLYFYLLCSDFIGDKLISPSQACFAHDSNWWVISPPLCQPMNLLLYFLFPVHLR